MKFLQAVVFILFSLAVSGSSFLLQRNQTDKLSKIEQGESICIENVPYYVMLKISGAYACGGALIDRDWVLTAAHCAKVASMMMPKFSIVAGSHNTKLYFGHSLFDRSISIAAEHIEIHPDYGKRSSRSLSGENDLALIKLVKKFPLTKRIKPASLPKQNVKVNDELILAGIGRLDFENRSSCLQYYKPLVMNCSIYVKSAPSVGDMFCHKGKPGQRTHVGDSGSPVVNSRNEVVGIHKGTLTTLDHTFQKAVNVYHYLDWIKEKMNGYLTNEIET